MRAKAFLSLALSLAIAGAAQAAPQTLYSFTDGADGGFPVQPMLGVNGVLYGVSSAGGAHKSGTVYAFNPATKILTTLYDFPANTQFPLNVSNGPLVYRNGTLYGTTAFGGSLGQGTIFQVDIASKSGAISYQFQGSQDGGGPVYGMISQKNTLIGTTESGGLSNAACDAGGCGVVFQFDPVTDTETTLYAFENSGDGEFPTGLTAAFGNVFGVAGKGGSATCKCGTVFRIPPSGGTPITLHSFAGGSDGNGPASALLRVGNLLYGATYVGGTGPCFFNYGCGTLYSINPRTGEEEVLYSFKGGRDGYGLASSLVYLRGKLYGVTYFGGTSTCHERQGCGVLFQYDIASHQERVAYKFYLPGLGYDSAKATIMVMGNTLYGTTSASDGSPGGTIFSYTP